jgi:hypothetical protein
LARAGRPGPGGIVARLGRHRRRLPARVPGARRPDRPRADAGHAWIDSRIRIPGTISSRDSRGRGLSRGGPHDWLIGYRQAPAAGGRSLTRRRRPGPETEDVGGYSRRSWDALVTTTYASVRPPPRPSSAGDSAPRSPFCPVRGPPVYGVLGKKCRNAVRCPPGPRPRDGARSGRGPSPPHSLARAGIPRPSRGRVRRPRPVPWRPPG